MAGPSKYGPCILESEARNLHLRLICSALEPSRRPLMYIFEEMTKGKSPNEDLMEYLERIGKKPKSKVLNAQQKNTIKNDPLCRSFDLSLLFILIQGFCGEIDERFKNVWTAADSLKHLIQSIKNRRNDAMHETPGLDKTEFDNRLRSLQELLEETWKRIEDAFGIDTEHEIKKMKKDLKIIKEAPFEDVRVYLKELQALMDKEGVASMKEIYKSYLSEAPDVHLLKVGPGTRQQTKILDIFTEMHIIGKRFDVKVDFRDWLKEIERERAKHNNKSKFLLVEGVAGVGKTTLSRKIVLDWSHGNDTMDHLLDNQLLIYMQFRERHIETLPALYLTTMPYMIDKVNPEYLMLLSEGRNIIFVCDGLDEKNDGSYQLFKEILQFGKKRPITVICTTRPEEVDRLTVNSHYAYLHIRVLGISEENRSTFITKYLTARGKDPQPLVNYLNKTSVSLQEHWRFPYNLMCLAILWELSPTRINTLTTATELFEATLDEIKKKLNSRQPGRDIPHKDMENILKTLFHLALINHRTGIIMLPDDSLQMLKNECSHLNLDCENITSTFLSQIVSWSDSKASYFSFPHKGLQDYYAAQSILKKLQACTPDTEKLLSDFKEMLEDKGYPPDSREYILSRVKLSLDPEIPRTIREVLLGSRKEDGSSSSHIEDLIRSSQNVFTHLVGILYYRSGAVTPERAEELVQLLKECGITSEEQWMDLLELTRCDGTFCRLIAPQIVQGYDFLLIEDARVQAYTSILPHCTDVVTSISVSITNDPNDILCLKELLKVIAGKQWKLTLHFIDDFKHPKLDGSCLEQEIQQFSKCDLVTFEGQLSLSSLKSLPECLTELRTSVATEEQYKDIEPFLSKLDSRLPCLKVFRLHTPAEFTDKEILQPLPQKDTLELCLQIDIVEEQNLKWACEAASKLQPANGQLGELLLHRMGRRAASAIEALAREGVRLARLNVTPRSDDEKSLKKMAKKKLACEFVSWTPAYDGDVSHKRYIEMIRKHPETTCNIPLFELDDLEIPDEFF